MTKLYDNEMYDMNWMNDSTLSRILIKASHDIPTSLDVAMFWSYVILPNNIKYINYFPFKEIYVENNWIMSNFSIPNTNLTSCNTWLRWKGKQSCNLLFSAPSTFKRLAFYLDLTNVLSPPRWKVSFKFFSSNIGYSFRL